jgi:hypothetical protein
MWVFYTSLKDIRDFCFRVSNISNFCWEFSIAAGFIDKLFPLQLYFERRVTDTVARSCLSCFGESHKENSLLQDLHQGNITCLYSVIKR